MEHAILEHIRTILASSDSRIVRAERLADVLRSLRAYRWVGVYDVTDDEIAIIAWGGPGAPAYPRFSATKGLSGEAVASRRTIVSNDVANDRRYLTAFGSTQSEIIVPVMSSSTGKVIGTVDVESERKDAFSETDQALLEACARAAVGLWST